MTDCHLTDWATALDQFEQRLTAFRSVLEADGLPVSGLWPPSNLLDVPLPPELVPRARGLLAAARELEGELVARRAELPRVRQTVRYRRTPAFSTISTEL